MSNWIFKRAGRSRLVNWLDLDSQIDAGLFGAWESFKDRWNAWSTFFARFRLTGAPRVLNELVSEAATLGTGGMMLMLVLAQPAFEAAQKEDWLNDGNISVTFLDKNGNEIGKRGVFRSDAVPLDEYPDIVIKALLATEDRRFYDHWGIDVFGTFRALAENVRANDVVQGGSSITQQLAKNLFLSSERSIERKIKELFLAFWLENRLTKDEILKLYLERAYMGGGAFGFEAASHFYFGKSVRDVTLAEAAMLSGLPKAPTKYAPHINLAAARARADDALTNMVQAGFMTEGQVHGARLNPARPIDTRNLDSPDYYLDWAFEEVKRITEGFPDQVFTARATVDLAIQRAADTTIHNLISQQGRSNRFKQSALVSMEHDGAVRALVGGYDYGENQFNRATQARRQPGSSFKSYVYLTALENGFTPNTVARDVSPSCGNWAPRNYGGGASGSRVTLREALARSLNTVAVYLSLKVGREKVLANLDKLNIHGVTKSCSMALGDTGISPLEHTGGYTAFANGGKPVRPYAILEITNTKGELLYSHDRDAPPLVQAFDPEVIANLNSMLGAVVSEGTGTRAALEFTAVGGKTGTSSGWKDAWFLGMTGKLVTGIWVGNDDFRPMSNVTGGVFVAPAWKTFMTAALSGVSPGEIVDIPGIPAHPVQLADRQRLLSLTGTDPTAGEQKTVTDTGVMSDATRAIIERLGQAMRKAAQSSGERTGEKAAGDGRKAALPAGTAPAATLVYASGAPAPALVVP